jgi:hypothetical protein
MDSNETGMTAGDSSPRMTPPLERGALPEGEARSSRWPTVIGTIGIVLASLGLFCGCMGYFGPALAQWGVDMQTQQGQTPDPYAVASVQAQRNLFMFAAIVTTAGMIVAVLQMVGSISLVRRRPSARSLMMVYAILAIVMACVGAGFQIMLNGETERLAAEQGAQAPAGFGAIGLIIGLSFGIVLGLGWPVFLLIWFSRRKIRDEVEQWGESAPV